MKATGKFEGNAFAISGTGEDVEADEWGEVVIDWLSGLLWYEYDPNQSAGITFARTAPTISAMLSSLHRIGLIDELTISGLGKVSADFASPDVVF